MFFWVPWHCFFCKIPLVLKKGISAHTAAKELCGGARMPPLQCACPAAAHTGTGHTLPRTMTMEGCYSPGKEPPTPTIPSPLDSGQGQAPCSTRGPPCRKCGFILGEASVPIPASLLHACPSASRGSSFPSLLLWATSTPGSRARPCQGATLPGSLAPAPASGTLASPQHHWTPPVGGPPHP